MEAATVTSGRPARSAARQAVVTVRHIASADAERQMAQTRRRSGGLLNRYRGVAVPVENGRRHPGPEVAGLVPLDERRYGETVITRPSAPCAEQNPGGAGDG